MINIITVNFNNLSGLKCTAESIMAQDTSSFHWIIIDGASQDGSVEYLESLKQSSPGTILTVISEPDDGVYFAMNKGLLYVKSGYVQFLNSGDVLKTNSEISKISRIISEKEGSVIYSDIEISVRDKLLRAWKAKELTKLKLYIGWMPPHPTTYYPIAALTEAKGYDTQFSIAADYDLFLRLLYANHKFYYYNHTSVIMEPPGKSGRNLKQVIKANLECLRSCRRLTTFVPIWILVSKPVSKLMQFRFRPEH